MNTENNYNVLFGFDGIYTKGTELHSVHEVSDFILTHNGGVITEEDGTPLLEIQDGEFVYCNDMQYRDELAAELRKGERFEERYYE